MKNKNILWIILGIFIIGTLALKGTKSKEEIIKDYMKDKYKEEFVIELMGKRDGEIIAEVLPKKYIGTIRQYDSYYSSSVFLSPNEDIGDNYGGVLLKESANEYFRPKLEELFGKNILPVLTLEGGYDFPDFKKEMEKRQKKFIKYPNGRFSPLSGGIYIFGRVENEADREYYRKQIYEFIQYLKAENMFDYVDLTVYISDERYLSTKFQSLKIQDELNKNYKEYANKKSTSLVELESFRTRKKDIYSKIGEDYSVDNKKLYLIKKDSVIKIDEELLAGVLLSSRIVSKNVINTNKYFHQEKKLKEYDKLEDVEF